MAAQLTEVAVLLTKNIDFLSVDGTMTVRSKDKKGRKMSDKLSLKAMKAEMMSPLINPLVEPQQIKTKQRLVKSGRNEDLVNPVTGEITGIAAIHQIEERDDAEFVKVFAAGVSATYELTKTAQRVFQVVLDQYQRTPMSRGYADSVELFWFDSGIDGRDAGMSERTWMRGLKELLEKRFLYPKPPAVIGPIPRYSSKGTECCSSRSTGEEAKRHKRS